MSSAVNVAVALIFDGLIYLNMSGTPIDPSVVELDPFGVAKLPEGAVGVKNTFPIIPGSLPSDMPFWAILTEDATADAYFPTISPSNSCCLPNAICFLTPSIAGDISERVRGKAGPFWLRDFSAHIDFRRVYEISQVGAGNYIILRESHVFGLSVAFAPLRCTISDTSSRDVFSLPHSLLAAKLFCGWFKLDDDYFVLRIIAMPPGSPESTVEAVGSIADTAISVTKKKISQEGE